MIRIMVVVALFLAGPGTAGAGEKIVHQLKGDHDYSLLCPCEFGRSLGGPDEGSYGALDNSGGLDIIFRSAPNEEKPFARINLGKEDIHLTPVGRATYECKPGQVWSPRWKAGDVSVSAKLTVRRPGEESCWFTGTLSVKTKGKSETVGVKGACGC